MLSILPEIPLGEFKGLVSIKIRIEEQRKAEKKDLDYSMQPTAMTSSSETVEDRCQCLWNLFHCHDRCYRTVCRAMAITCRCDRERFDFHISHAGTSLCLLITQPCETCCDNLYTCTHFVLFVLSASAKMGFIFLCWKYCQLPNNEYVLACIFYQHPCPALNTMENHSYMWILSLLIWCTLYLPLLSNCDGKKLSLIYSPQSQGLLWALDTLCPGSYIHHVHSPETNTNHGPPWHHQT